jgi:hypothetical protein
MIFDANFEAFNCILEMVISLKKLDFVSKKSHEIINNKMKVTVKKKE